MSCTNCRAGAPCQEHQGDATPEAHPADLRRTAVDGPGTEAPVGDTEPQVKTGQEALRPGWQIILEDVSAVPLRTCSLNEAPGVILAAFAQNYESFIRAAAIADMQIRARVNEYIPKEHLGLIATTMQEVMTESWMHVWQPAWIDFLVNHGFSAAEMWENVVKAPGWSIRHCNCGHAACEGASAKYGGIPANDILMEIVLHFKALKQAERPIVDHRRIPLDALGILEQDMLQEMDERGELNLEG